MNVTLVTCLISYRNWSRIAQFDLNLWFTLEHMRCIVFGLKYWIKRILQVHPSLDISFQISPCPSRLEEFLVRMDVINRTSSQNFQFHQLSSVGNDWEISLVQPIASIFPSELLQASQALSFYLKLKVSNNWIVWLGMSLKGHSVYPTFLNWSCHASIILYNSFGFNIDVWVT